MASAHSTFYIMFEYYMIKNIAITCIIIIYKVVVLSYFKYPVIRNNLLIEG